MLKVIQDSNPWYSEGLRFECTGCGKCCTGSPGYIWLDEDEVEAIAAYLDITIQEFGQKYLRRVKGRLSLLEMPKNYDCVFLDENRCKIYPVRPTQCKTFPWWPQTLKSEEEWKKAAQFCEGIQNNAPLIPFEKIQEQLEIQEQANEK